LAQVLKVWLLYATGRAMGETFSQACSCARGGDSRVVTKDAEYAAVPSKDDHPPVKAAAVGHHALKGNTYDAITWAVIKMNDPTYQQMKGKCHLYVGLVITLVMNFVAITLQIGATFGLLQFTVARYEDKYTSGGEDQRKSTLLIHEAIANNTPLNNVTHGHIISMCEHDHNVPYTQSVMTWIWGMKLLPAVSQALWVLVFVMMMPRAQPDDHWVEKKEKTLDIVRMGTSAKIFVVLFVDGPRVLVTIYLYWMGANFLMYAKSLGTLIMKSIGLAFISQLPDVIFQGAFSEATQKEMSNVKLTYEERAEDDKSTCLESWNLFGSTTVKVFGVLIISLYYCRILCGDLQALREACILYKYKFVLPLCPTCGSHLFGFTLYN
jgi:hypothetical protein